MTNFSVTQFGKTLPKSKYTWDEKTKTFSTAENDLVLDFNKIDGITFNTGSNCIFITGSNCTFNTGSYCTFKTGSYCTFNTGKNCTFINTGSYCTFNTSWNCTFITGWNCTFKTSDNCVAIRHDVKGVIEIPLNQTIKLNDYGVSGYTIINDPPKELSLSGKKVEVILDGKKYTVKHFQNLNILGMKRLKPFLPLNMLIPLKKHN